MELAFDLETSFMVTAHLFDQKHCVGEVWAKSNKGERIYDPDKDFFT